MTNPDQEVTDYFFRVRRYVRPCGERFVFVAEKSGVPAYYPTALALSRRSRGLSAETMAAEASDLVHLGLWALRENIDLNRRLEAGNYFGPVEIDTLAEACSLRTKALRRITSRSVAEIRRGAALSKADLVTNEQKARRLTTALRYFEFVGRMSEAWLPKRSDELADRISSREAMSFIIEQHRPRIKKSRVRGLICRASTTLSAGDNHLGRFSGR